MSGKSNLRDRFAKIYNLLGKSKRLDHDKMIGALTKYLDGFSKRCIFAIEFENEKKYFIQLADKHASIIDYSEVTHVDFEIFFEETTALRVAKGIISPIYALGREKMRISGNTDIAIQVYKKLAADNGYIDPCKRN